MSDADLLIALTHRDMLTVSEAALWFNVIRGWFFDRIERREIPYQEERSKIRKYIINNKL